MAVITPNMNLIQSTIAVDSGLNWEINLNSSLSLIDAHDHSPGKGIPINSASINISTDLPINGNNLTIVRSVRFQPQSSALSGPADLGCIYESGVDLWYNDGNGNQIQITSGGTVNATSSGISSGTNTASFVSNVLVVNESSNKPADIQVASVLLGNNTVGTKYLTLSPPSAMPANFNLVLPSLPAVQSIMALDTSGNITAPYTVDNSTISIISGVIQVPTGGITDTQILTQTITVDKLNAMTTNSSAATLSNMLYTASSGAFSAGPTGSPPATIAINNLAGSLITSGRPIYVSLSSDLSGNPSYVGLRSSFTNPSSVDGSITFIIDGVHEINLDFAVINSGVAVGDTSIIQKIPSSAYSFIIPLSAGTHTIVASVQINTTNTVMYVNATNLIAYEI